MGDLPGIAVGTMGPGDAVIELKPVKYEDGKIVVEYFANTHCVSLGSYSLLESTSLTVGGKIFRPADADDLHGHHPKGRITFLLDGLPGSFTIVTRGIPAVDERIDEWKQGRGIRHGNEYVPRPERGEGSHLQRGKEVKLGEDNESQQQEEHDSEVLRLVLGTREDPGEAF